MTELIWNQVGERKFRAGVDRGVLYLPDGTAVPWNGLTGIDEAPSTESKAFYQDGIKYLDHQVLGEFAGTLRAYTYPEEFEACIGTASKGNGLFFHDQPPKSFGLSYRTLLGNDTEGLDHGYVLHLLYGLRAVPSSFTNATIGASTAASEMTWGLTSTPQLVPGRRPTAHLSIKSTDVGLGTMQFIESLLYGSQIETPYLPSIVELLDFFDNPVSVVDNGDGTWTATGSNRAVVLLSDTAFQINGVDATYLSPDTYEIPTDA